MQLFPYECNCDVKQWRTKYIPIYIKSKKINNKKYETNDNIKKKENKEKILTKHPENKKKQSSASIGNHSSTHGGSIVPSVWIDDDDSDTNYEFKY